MSCSTSTTPHITLKQKEVIAKNMKLNRFTRTAILLALAVASQFLKSLSVYITGPIINCILIICVLYCGLGNAAILCVVLPLTSWLITGSPIMSAMPVIVPCIMAGNFVLVLSVWLFDRRSSTGRSILSGMAIGCVVKALLMWLTISCLVLSLVGSSSGLPAPALAAAKLTFSVTQLITAVIGCIPVPIIKAAIDKSKD